MPVKYILILAAILLLVLIISFRKILGKIVSAASIVLVVAATIYVILAFAQVVPVPDWLMEIATKYFM